MNIFLTGLRKRVFFPTFIIFFSFIVLFFFQEKLALETMEQTQDWILHYFNVGFTVLAFVTLMSCGVVYLSPLRHVRIGGENAQPLLDKWSWFTISLCTTIAVGVLFWAPAEPLYHYHNPPDSQPFSGMSRESELFAIATMYLHWSFTPYSIYMSHSLTRALMIYNLERPSNLGSSFEPILGKTAGQKWSFLFDGMSLFALVTGVSASLASGILLISGALDSLLGIAPSPLVKTLVCTSIVVAFIISATSGLTRGIRVLSDLNTRVLIAIAVFIFIFGPSLTIVESGMMSFSFYVKNFFQMSLLDSLFSDDVWYQDWTVFYWSIWLAWAPMAGFFLARIARGYTVKEMIEMNFFIPSLLTCVWMSIFAGTSIHMDNENSLELFHLLKDKGPESIIYNVLEHLPFSQVSQYALLFIIFLSFVTAADSSTDIMSTVCSKKAGRSESKDSTGLILKIVWGLSIGVIAWISALYTGVDGLRMLSNIGGLPGLLIVFFMTISLWILMIKGNHYFSKS